MNSKQVMERTVLPAGKVFIKEGEEHSRAYIIQIGDVRAFRTIDGKRVDIKDYGPNTIIGETNLFDDQLSDCSYEAINTVTVITITRHDFEKRLQKCDSVIKTVFKHMLFKIDTLQIEDEDKTSEIDDAAFQFVKSITADISEDKKRDYEVAMLPHINSLIKTVQKLKGSQ